MRIKELRLTNFRNYESLELCPSSGINLIEGANGNGKTNLLESIYLMSVGRSPRTSTDRELVRTDSLADFAVHSQAAATVATQNGEFRLQVDLSSGPTEVAAPSGVQSPHAQKVRRVQKTFRVNGVPRRSAEFVGLLKAVLFSAEDIYLTGGPPSARRRYVDILVSHLVSGYVSELQRYNRILSHRNHLLKSVRVGSSGLSELDYWDIELAVSGARVMDARIGAVEDLNRGSQPIHSQLSGSDRPLRLIYRPSVDLGTHSDFRELSNSLLATVQENRNRDIGAGHSLIGPHRDDLLVYIGDEEVSSFASRGQARIAVLAMKMGEAQLLADLTGDQPVILLDDVMSELDDRRRRQVIERALDYEQVLVTTAEEDLGAAFGNYAVSRFAVGPNGVVTPAVAT